MAFFSFNLFINCYLFSVFRCTIRHYFQNIILFLNKIRTKNLSIFIRFSNLRYQRGNFIDVHISINKIRWEDRCEQLYKFGYVIFVPLFLHLLFILAIHMNFFIFFYKNRSITPSWLRIELLIFRWWSNNWFFWFSLFQCFVLNYKVNKIERDSYFSSIII